jgi:hypothetical protein
MAHTNDRAGLAIPLTLAIDIGGSHLKALSRRFGLAVPLAVR